MNSLFFKEEIIYFILLEIKENRNIKILFVFIKLGKVF